AQRAATEPDLARLIDVAALASSRLDQLEAELSPEDLRSDDDAKRARWHVRDRWAARILQVTAFLDAMRARAVMAKARGALAELVQTFHAAGAILRDLDPRSIVVAADGMWFTDVGHARLAILSSRTASSLLLESSPYLAPEALVETIVDARADIYSIGVVLWR